MWLYYKLMQVFSKLINSFWYISTSLGTFSPDHVTISILNYKLMRVVLNKTNQYFGVYISTFTSWFLKIYIFFLCNTVYMGIVEWKKKTNTEPILGMFVIKFTQCTPQHELQSISRITEPILGFLDIVHQTHSLNFRLIELILGLFGLIYIMVHQTRSLNISTSQEPLNQYQACLYSYLDIV